MSKTAQKKSFATPLEQMTISNALAQYCSAGENGFAKYVDGMSEEKLINDVIIPTLSKAGKFSEDRRNAIEKHVKHLRTSVFGNLRQASHGTNQYTMAVEKIDGIIERLTVLEGRFAKLVQTLGAAAPDVYHYPMPDGRWLVCKLRGDDIHKVVALAMAGHGEWVIEGP